MTYPLDAGIARFIPWIFLPFLIFLFPSRQTNRTLGHSKMGILAPDFRILSASQIEFVLLYRRPHRYNTARVRGGYTWLEIYINLATRWLAVNKHGETRRQLITISQ